MLAGRTRDGARGLTLVGAGEIEQRATHVGAQLVHLFVNAHLGLVSTTGGSVATLEGRGLHGGGRFSAVCVAARVSGERNRDRNDEQWWDAARCAAPSIAQ